MKNKAGGRLGDGEEGEGDWEVQIGSYKTVTGM